MKLIAIGLLIATALTAWQIKTENEAMDICQQTHSYDVCAATIN